MALPRVRGEGLRWPSAGFRRESVIFFRRLLFLVCVIPNEVRDLLFSSLATRRCFCIECLHPAKIPLCRSMVGHVAEGLPPAVRLIRSKDLAEAREVAG
jgi:hypothetical protein